MIRVYLTADDDTTTAEIQSVIDGETEAFDLVGLVDPDGTEVTVRIQLTDFYLGAHTWTFMGHWENDRIVVEYHVEGEQGDPRIDTGHWEQGLWAAAGTASTVAEAQRNAIEEYEHELHHDVVSTCRLCRLDEEIGQARKETDSEDTP